MIYKKRTEILETNELELASYQRRIFSIIFDIIIISIILIFIEIILQFLGFDVKNINAIGFNEVEFETRKVGSTTYHIIKYSLALIPTLYFTLTTYFMNGQTFGKKIFKIRIISLYHEEIGLWHCIERSLGYIASTLEFGLGFIQSVWNVNRMSLHDKIAETIVIKLDKQNKVIKKKETEIDK